MEKWEEVSVSEEFEQCCQEVASGEYACLLRTPSAVSLTIVRRWGPEGGKTLMALFRRLRSPNAIPYTRS